MNFKSKMATEAYKQMVQETGRETTTLSDIAKEKFGGPHNGHEFFMAMAAVAEVRLRGMALALETASKIETSSTAMTASMAMAAHEMDKHK